MRPAGFPAPRSDVPLPLGPGAEVLREWREVQRAEQQGWECVG
jgi:hypothetical protein